MIAEDDGWSTAFENDRRVDYCKDCEDASP